MNNLFQVPTTVNLLLPHAVFPLGRSHCSFNPGSSLGMSKSKENKMARLHVAKGDAYCAARQKFF